MRLEKASLSHAHRIITLTRAIFMEASEKGHHRPMAQFAENPDDNQDACDTKPAVFFGTEETSVQT